MDEIKEAGNGSGDNVELMCVHCLDLDFPGIYRQTPAVSKGATRSPFLDIETGQHPGFKSITALERCGGTCRCCAFLAQQVRDSIQQVRPHMGIPPGGMDNVPLLCDANRSARGLVWDRKSIIQVYIRDSLYNRIWAAIGLCISRPSVEQDESDLEFQCRDVKEQLDVRDGSNMIRSWHKQCFSDHPSCSKEGTSYLPNRVLSVGTAQTPALRIVETTSEEGRYIALSYCWGSEARQVKTLSANLEEFKICIHESTLPATIRDAIAMTRALDIPYLWIDALCIIQDNERDWETQSAKMASVYGKAFLTLCASNASSVHDGLLHRRRDTLLPVGQVSHNEADEILYLVPNMLENTTSHQILQNSPLSSRGWALQERLLSPRNVHFQNLQLIWECDENLQFETGLTQFQRRILSPMVDPKLPSLPTPNSKMDIPDGYLLFHSVRSEWQEIVTTYTTCKLTKTSDRLPAIGALAMSFVDRFRNAGPADKKTSPKYFAGEWEHDLKMARLWRLEERMTPRMSGQYIAPSWSWASIPQGHKVVYRGSHPIHVEWFATNVEFHAALTGSNAFGAVKYGWVSLCVPLMQGLYDRNADDFIYKGVYRLQGIMNSWNSGVYLDYIPEVLPEVIYLAILENDARGYTPGLCGLVLQATDNESTYTRVGAFWDCKLVNFVDPGDKRGDEEICNLRNAVRWIKIV